VRFRVPELSVAGLPCLMWRVFCIRIWQLKPGWASTMQSLKIK